VNYSSLREARLTNWAQADPIQQLFIDGFCRPFREEWTERAILEGYLEAPGFLTDPVMRAAYLRDEWRGPEKRWVDPSKMAAAKKVLRTLGLTTHRDELNEQGKDWRETFEQLADEKDLADELGIVLGEATGGGGGTPGANPGEVSEKEEPELSEGQIDDLKHVLLDAFEDAGVSPQAAAYALDYEKETE